MSKPKITAEDLESSMSYVACEPGLPGFRAVCTDHPAFRKETARTVASWIRSGATVERVSHQEASKGLGVYCKAMALIEEEALKAGVPLKNKLRV